MVIERVVSSYLLSNMYIIREDDHIIVIDPCEVDIPLNEFITDYILLTHEHIDHISGVNYWKRMTDAKVLCNKECARNICDPKKNMSHYYGAFCAIQSWAPKTEVEDIGDYVCEADIVYSDEYMFDWRGYKIKCVSTPGHSAGSSYIMIDDNCIFSGDSIIKGYEPTLRFPGGSKKKWLEEGLPKIKELDGNIMVYPGHFDSFLLAEYTWK